MIDRLHDRRRSADDETELSWPEFQKRSPKLARAGIRFLLSGRPADPARRAARRGLPPPARPRRLARAAGGLRAALPGAAIRRGKAADRYDAIAAALRELGFNLTRKGIRRGTSEVDRLLTGSQAKALGLVDVVAHEHEHRGDAIRALVLCDAELATQRPDDALTGVLDPAAGTARHALLAIAADDRVAHLRPLLVSGRGLRCHPNDADVLLEALEATAEDHFKLTEWEAEPDGLLVTLQLPGRGVDAARVGGAGHAPVRRGHTQLLVGTRALLGEGWNCPPLNVLIDMTIATTGVSVQQMRGRSLRLDPADPQKVASNWDIVCVAPDLVRGSADYERFVRKHLNLFAPAEDGEVEAGPSHVHPELGPFGPPPVERFRDLNRELLARAADRDGARERWQIGTPYRGVELPTLLVRSRSGERRGAARDDQAPGARCISPSGSRSRTGLGGGVAFGVLGVAASAPPLLVGLALVPAGLAWAAVRLGAAKKRLPLVLPLDAVRPRGDRGLQGARRAEPGGRVEPHDRAAQLGLPALRARRRPRPRRASGSRPRSTSS